MNNIEQNVLLHSCTYHPKKNEDEGHNMIVMPNRKVVNNISKPMRMKLIIFLTIL